MAAVKGFVSRSWQMILDRGDGGGWHFLLAKDVRASEAETCSGSGLLKRSGGYDPTVSDGYRWSRAGEPGVFETFAFIPDNQTPQGVMVL